MYHINRKLTLEPKVVINLRIVVVINLPTVELPTTTIRRLITLEPKVVINLRIVVVGSSTVGLSTLQTFVFW